MSAGLRQKAARGVLLVTALKVLTTVTARIAQIVMPLFLLPTDFGIFALAVFFSGFFSLAGDLGLSTELVRRKDSFEQATDTAFTLRIALASGLVVVSVVVGWIASLAYAEPRLSLPVIVLSFGLFAQAVSMVPRVMATRSLDFKKAAIPDAVGKLSTPILSVWLAVLGLAYWSPVYGLIIGGLVGAALQLLFSRWRPRLRFHRKLAREILRFGGFVSIAVFGNYVAHSLDSAIVGLVLGLAPLGYYAIASSWAVYFTSNLSSILETVGYPVLSRVVDSKTRTLRALSENLKYFNYAGIGATCAVITLSPLFILSLYGSAWTPSVSVMQILAPAGLIFGYTAFAGDVLYASGRSKEVSIATWTEAVLMAIIGPLLTLSFGLAGMGVTVLCGALVSLLMVIRSMTTATSVSPRLWAVAMVKPALAAIPSSISGVALATVLKPSLSSLLAAFLVYTIVYVLALELVTRGEFLREVKSALRLAIAEEG